MEREIRSNAVTAMPLKLVKPAETFRPQLTEYKRAITKGDAILLCESHLHGKSIANN